MFHKKDDGCKNNPKSSFIIKIGEHIPSGFSMPTISASKSIENKYDVLLKKHQNYLKGSIFECFLQKDNSPLLF